MNAARRTPLAEVALGWRLALRGLAFMRKHPQHAARGLIPPLVVGGFILASVIVLAVFAPALAEAMTPFAANWDRWTRDMTRGAVAIGLVVAYAIAMVLVFASVTLAVGFPIYDKISASVDGTLPSPVVESARERSNIVADIAVSVSKGIGVGLLAFVVGLIPVVGQVAGFTVGAVAGAWLLSLDLLESPMGRRGITRRKSRRAIAQPRRALCIGFGLPIYLCMLVPILSVVLFPSAVAGAVFLTRELRGEPTS